MGIQMKKQLLLLIESSWVQTREKFSVLLQKYHFRQDKSKQESFNKKY